MIRSSGTMSRYSARKSDVMPFGWTPFSRSWPPTRKSCSRISSFQPSGPANQRALAALSAHARNTSGTGASKTRSMVKWPCSTARAGPLFPSAIVFLLPLKLAQIFVQPVETRFPKLAVFLQPFIHSLQHRRFDPADVRASPHVAAHKARPLQHLHMLGRGGERHVERFGQLADVVLAQDKRSQHRAPRGIG